MKQFLSSIFIVLFLLPSPLLAKEQYIYLTRHAEKVSDTPNPGLTAQGQLRAKWLADYLKDKSIEVFYSTNYKRTKQTSAPAASAYEKDIIIYKPGTQSDFAIMLLNDGRNSFVSGHSNTIPALVSLLGGEAGQPIEENQYDRLYILIVNEKGQVITRVIKSQLSR